MWCRICVLRNGTDVDVCTKWSRGGPPVLMVRLLCEEMRGGRWIMLLPSPAISMPVLCDIFYCVLYSVIVTKFKESD